MDLPSSWDPRPYQLPLWCYLQGGGKRAVAVWHRRSGKDSTALNWTAVAALDERVGVYWHMLPQAAQGRKVVWDAVDGRGRRIIDQVWPKAVRVGMNADDMRLTLKNGSVWQVVGSDNYDSLVGSNPVGVVFSEYALAKPAAWDFIRPILVENGGWALFIYTPRGENHGYELFKMAESDPVWFCQRLSVEDTGAIPLEAIDKERAEGVEEAVIQQEYYCSFTSPLKGAYYGQWMAAALGEGRITDVPHRPDEPVETWWDLGIGDDTAIWFVQKVGDFVHVIDYYQAAGFGLDHYARLVNTKPYTYKEHLWPHDGAQRELTSGKSRRELAEDLGLRPIRIIRQSPVDAGIQAVRTLLPMCRFNAGPLSVKHGTGEARVSGLDVLRGYHRYWSRQHKRYTDRPDHDKFSHGADAFRTGAMGTERTPRATPDLSGLNRRSWTG